MADTMMYTSPDTISPLSPSAYMDNQRLASTIYSHCQRHILPSADDSSLPPHAQSSLGVFVQTHDGLLYHEPAKIDTVLAELVSALRLPAAVSISSDAINELISHFSPFQQDFILGVDGPNVPVIRSIHSVLNGEVQLSREAYVCVFRQERLMLLWSEPTSLINHANDILERRIPRVLWEHAVSGSLQRSPPPTPGFRHTKSATSLHHSTAPQSALQSGIQTPHLLGRPGSPAQGSMYTIESYAPSLFREKDEFAMSPEMKSKIEIITRAVEKEERGPSDFDEEKGGVAKRPFLLTHSFLVTLAVTLALIVQLSSVAKLLGEWRLDGSYKRFALVALIPMFLGFSLFFFVVVVGSLFQLFAPLGGLRTNSRFCSPVKPKPGHHKGMELPHITIQMPVYKEGLKGVIMPTLESCMAAIRYYESQGGTASIFVNDDGMQLVTPDLAEARKAYYEVNRIGWCSRPGHCEDKDSPKYFIRKGKFKKASNMNYCLYFALRVDEEWLRLVGDVCRQRGCTQDELTVEEEMDLYNIAHKTIVDSDGGATWAAGDVRMGELVLIIDSDTRVPEDCLLYGALEMAESPEVAILQHASGVMAVTNKFFENGITWFTNLIYTQIQFAVGSGDVAPFVGHNSILRWKVLQSIAFEEDGRTKFWSENHVSEDFDVSLRVQMQGFTVRMATYHDGGFKEGVSLTVYDELARWEKYAYGCNELVFNPLIRWPTRGPFTRLFLRFLWSNIKITSKITIIGYILTYYAVASAVPLALCNYIMLGLFGDQIDQFYLTSFRMWVGMAVIFNLLSPLAYAFLRHRIGQQSFLRALWDCIKWLPMFLLFFGGISFHLTLALCCHFLSINISWTTTAKELQQTSFRMGIDRVVRDFKWMYLTLLPVVGGMVYLGVGAPTGFRIEDFSVILPLANQVACHLLLPFVLGPFASQFW